MENNEGLQTKPEWWNLSSLISSKVVILTVPQSGCTNTFLSHQAVQQPMPVVNGTGTAAIMELRSFPLSRQDWEQK